MSNPDIMSLDALRAPLQLARGPSLPNRLANAAMSENLATDVGTPTAELIELYRRLGTGGMGLLITGNVIVDLNGRTESRNVVVQDDRHVELLRLWAEAGQAEGARVYTQISHAGRQTNRSVTWQPVAPSAVPLTGMGGLFANPRPLEDAEIRTLVERFATAAQVSEAAGFSGAQIHAAHGYLVSQFLSPRTNKRTDGWGGSLDNRMRFLLEIVRAARRATSPAFSLAVKLNSADFQRGGFTFEDSVRVAQALEAEGIDLLEVSGGTYEKAAMMGAARESTRQREAFFLEYAQKIREEVSLPLMVTGGFRSARGMLDARATGAVDVIGIGRPVTVYPDLASGILAGTLEEIPPLDPSVGVRKLDDALQVLWFQRQLQRMGRGLDPRPNLGRFSTLAIGFGHTYWGLLRPKGQSDAPGLSTPSR